MKVVSKQDDVQPKTRKKLVPVHKGLAKKVQTWNKYAALKVEKGEKEGNNQLVLAEDATVT